MLTNDFFCILLGDVCLHEDDGRFQHVATEAAAVLDQGVVLLVFANGVLADHGMCGDVCLREDGVGVQDVSGAAALVLPRDGVSLVHIVEMFVLCIVL